MSRTFAFGSALLLYFSWNWLTIFIPSGLPHEVILMPTLVANSDLYIDYNHKIANQGFWFVTSAVSFGFSLNLIITILGMLLNGGLNIWITLFAVLTNCFILYPVLYIANNTNAIASIISVIIACILIASAVLWLTANLRITYFPYVLYGLVLIVVLIILPIFRFKLEMPLDNISADSTSNFEVAATTSAQEFQIQSTQTSVTQVAVDPADNETYTTNEGTVPENKGMLVLLLEFVDKLLSAPAWNGVGVILAVVVMLLNRHLNNHTPV